MGEVEGVRELGSPCEFFRPKPVSSVSGSSFVFLFCFFGAKQRMDSMHPFLGGAYLWFDPIDYFFPYDERANKRLSLRWDKLRRIRRIAPTNRIVDPEPCGRTPPPKKVTKNPVHLPDMRTIVRALCPNMPQFVPASRSTPAASRVDREEGHGDEVMEDMGGVQAGGLQGPFLNEDDGIGSDAEIDWDWWGNSGSNSVQHIILSW